MFAKSTKNLTMDGYWPVEILKEMENDAYFWVSRYNMYNLLKQMHEIVNFQEMFIQNSQ